MGEHGNALATADYERIAAVVCQKKSDKAHPEHCPADFSPAGSGWVRG